MDSQVAPTMLKVHLKVSKCNQFGRGINVFIGHTEDDLYPVVAVLNYIAQRGDQPGPFFRFSDHTPLTKARFITKVREAPTSAGVDCSSYSRHSFSNRSSDHCCHGRCGGLGDTDVREMD